MLTKFQSENFAEDAHKIKLRNDYSEGIISNISRILYRIYPEKQAIRGRGCISCTGRGTRTAASPFNELCVYRFRADFQKKTNGKKTLRTLSIDPHGKKRVTVKRRARYYVNARKTYLLY